MILDVLLWLFIEMKICLDDCMFVDSVKCMINNFVEI